MGAAGRDDAVPRDAPAVLWVGAAGSAGRHDDANRHSRTGFGSIIAGIYVVQLAVVLWLLRWIARRLVSGLSPRALGLTAAGLIVASLAPIYFYDCMDGHSLMRWSMPACSARRSLTATSVVTWVGDVTCASVRLTGARSVA